MKFCKCGCGQGVIGYRGRAEYVKGHNGRRPLADRFWEKVTPAGPDECWIWQGSLSRGYGQISVHKVPLKAHRVSWEMFFGDIPDELTVDHLCYTPRCVNPWHMDLVTLSENARRVRANQYKGRTHCKWGHEYLPGSYYERKGGARGCKACALRNAYESRDRKRNAAAQVHPDAPGASAKNSLDSLLGV